MPKIAVILSIILLAGCGPKEIGEGSAYQPETAREAAAAEVMRYPVTGMNSTQHRLYYYTRPDLVENYQNWKLRQYRSMMGLSPDPEDPAYRAKPKQRSPFRQ